MVEDDLATASRGTVDDLTRIANWRGFNPFTEHRLALYRRIQLRAARD